MSDPTARNPGGPGRRRLALLALRLVGGTALALWICAVSTPVWMPVAKPILTAAVRAAEPWPLTTESRVVEDGSTLQFRHIHESEHPVFPSVRMSSTLMGPALWLGLILAVPGLSPRRRLRDGAIGLGIILLVVIIAVVARVEHQYATVDVGPFPDLLDNWRGWLAYFLNMFFLEIGFYVTAMTLAAALHGRAWLSVFYSDAAPEHRST